MRLPGGKVQRCVLQHVLHVPDLSYNLVSVSKASEKGKVTEFEGLIVLRILMERLLLWL